MIAVVAVATGAGVDADTANRIEWKPKGPLLDAATEVCGVSKNQRTTSEDLKPGGEMNRCTKLCTVQSIQRTGEGSPDGWDQGKEAKTAYIDAKPAAMHAVWVANSEAREAFATVSPDGDGVFRFVKQMDRTNQGVAFWNCVRNDAGELVLTDEDKMKAWVKH